VAAGYAARLQADPGRFLRVQADRTREEVWQQVEQGLRKRGVL
jgi:dTMP kinase